MTDELYYQKYLKYKKKYLRLRDEMEGGFLGSLYEQYKQKKAKKLEDIFNIFNIRNNLENIKKENDNLKKINSIIDIVNEYNRNNGIKIINKKINEKINEKNNQTLSEYKLNESIDNVLKLINTTPYDKIIKNLLKIIIDFYEYRINIAKKK